MDEHLDRAATGPVWLKDPQVADCVSRVLLAGMLESKLYNLDAWVVMANHVHMLLQPKVPLWKAMMDLRSCSARAANTILGRAGRHFWQDESFDHRVRTRQERDAIVRYIEFNPVVAGLAAEPEEWPWSSAAEIADVRPLTEIARWS
jgi:putative transposase